MYILKFLNGLQWTKRAYNTHKGKVIVDFGGQIFGVFSVLLKKTKTKDINLFGGIFTESNLPNKITGWPWLV